MRRPVVLLTLVCVATFTSIGGQVLPADGSHETETRFVDSLRSVKSFGSWARGSAEINGETYSHSLTIYDECWAYEYPGYLEYNLGRDWLTFEATVGVRDDSDSGANYLFEVIADGQVLESEIVGFGESFEVNVSVENVLRLRLAETPIGNDSICEEDAWEGHAVYGEPVLKRPKAHQHERTVAFTVGQGRAFGKVSVPDGTGVCAAATRIIIQRYDYGWDKITETATAGDGTFSTTLRTRRGKYRAIALKTEVGATYPEHVCLKARSKPVSI